MYGKNIISWINIQKITKNYLIEIKQKRVHFIYKFSQIVLTKVHSSAINIVYFYKFEFSILQQARTLHRIYS